MSRSACLVVRSTPKPLQKIDPLPPSKNRPSSPTRKQTPFSHTKTGTLPPSKSTGHGTARPSDAATTSPSLVTAPPLPRCNSLFPPPFAQQQAIELRVRPTLQQDAALHRARCGAASAKAAAEHAARRMEGARAAADAAHARLVNAAAELCARRGALQVRL
eukprot:366027-Chlamydomonas_euryale.AAC.1